METIVSLIVYLLVLGVIFWLVGFIPQPAPIDTIVKILFVLLAVLACLSVLGIVKGNYLPVIRI